MICFGAVLCALVASIDVATDGNENPLAADTPVAVEVSADGTTTVAPVAESVVPTTVAPVAESVVPTTVAPLVESEKSPQSLEIDVKDSSGFKVEDAATTFKSNLGTVNELLKKAKELTVDSYKWPALTEEIKEIADKAKKAIVDHEDDTGALLHPKFMSGFQVADVIFPLLKFKATKELDTLPITSIMRQEAMIEAFQRILDTLDEVLSAKPKIASEVEMAIEEVKAARDLDRADTWMKKIDINRISLMLDKVNAGMKNESVLDENEVLGKMDERVKEVISEMQGMLKWDAVVGLSLSVNISMDISNNVAREDFRLPEDIVSQVKEIDFPHVALAIYSAQDSKTMQPTMEAFVLKCIGLSDAINTKSQSLTEKDETSNEFRTNLDALQGDLAELVDELDELIFKAKDGAAVALPELFTWLMDEMENALAMTEDEIVEMP